MDGMKWAHVVMSFFFFVSIANPMGYEESKNHLLSLSYPELQCLCKRYNLPAKKTHSQLASSIASLLEVSVYVMFGLYYFYFRVCYKYELVSSSI